MSDGAISGAAGWRAGRRVLRRRMGAGVRASGAALARRAKKSRPQRRPRLGRHREMIPGIGGAVTRPGVGELVAVHQSIAPSGQKPGAPHDSPSISAGRGRERPQHRPRGGHRARRQLRRPAASSRPACPLVRRQSGAVVRALARRRHAAADRGRYGGALRAGPAARGRTGRADRAALLLRGGPRWRRARTASASFARTGRPTGPAHCWRGAGRSMGAAFSGWRPRWPA